MGRGAEADESRRVSASVLGKTELVRYHHPPQRQLLDAAPLPTGPPKLQSHPAEANSDPSPGPGPTSFVSQRCTCLPSEKGEKTLQ
jgi:hypothetical protein